MKEMIHNNQFKRAFFFVAGIIATLAYRVIIFLEGSWLKISWYLGTVGFILYFGHRAQVQKKRALLVENNDLIKVVGGIKKINPEQKQALNYLVRTAVTSKARWNSLMILWLSVLALVVGIVFDFIL